MTDTGRLYSDLAWLWPMWGEASVEYARFSAHVSGLIRRHARRPVSTLLDIGCGGGKNIFNLKKDFRVTGLDLSPEMLAQAGALNPECEFIRGDMRSFMFGRTFDAVLMDDAISYMNNRADFAAAFRAAFSHLNPGGVMIATPDVTTETFRQNRTVVTPASGKTRPGHVDVVFVENVYDPDPSDDTYETTMIYLIRENGVLRVESDRLTLGIYSLDFWRQTLRGAGFELQEDAYEDGEDRYTVFACVKPA